MNWMVVWQWLPGVRTPFALLNKIFQLSVNDGMIFYFSQTQKIANMEQSNNLPAKKKWQQPEIVIISDINAKTHGGIHEHNYTSKVTPNGHAFYANMPGHSLFVKSVGNPLNSYLS
jgi:hypothetical protein